MANAGQKLREIVRALCVLTLLFFNFGHVPAAAAVAGDPVFSVASSTAAGTLCEEPRQDNRQAHHAPCHACRIGGSADLPPPPGFAAPVFRAAQQLEFAEAPQALSARPFAHVLGSRAPPLG